MNSLILFLLNFVFLGQINADFINPTSSSKYWVDNKYNIEWDFPNLNSNITHIFLTHSNPFVLSKYTNNQMVLADTLAPGNLNYEWHLPYELNKYNVSQIDWRILLSNSSTPYSGHIGSHTDNNLIILSDFFNIESNMNITFPLSLNTSLFKFQQYNITTAGFNYNDQYTINVYLTNQNELNNITLGSFDGNTTHFENEYFKIHQEESEIIGNYPRQYIFTLRQPSNLTNMYETPYLKIIAEQNGITRTTSGIPVLFLKVTIEDVSNQESIITTECINNLNIPCVYNIHIIHDGIESVYSNYNQNTYSLSKENGDYTIYSSIDNSDTSLNKITSNIIQFNHTTTTTTTTTTTLLTAITSLTSTPSLTSSTSFYVGETNTTCSEDDDCEESDNFVMIIIFIILAIICLISAWYYYWQLSKNGKPNRIHPIDSQLRNPQNDLEMGQRSVINQNYEENSMTEETNLDNNYGDPKELEDIPNNVYQEPHPKESFYPDLDEIEKNMSDRGQAIVNDVYSSDLKPNEDDPEFYKYYDNYGFKRQIRRRHSSGSYNYHYSMTPVLPPSFKEFHYYNKLNGNNNNFDDYNHLERSSSFVTMPPLNRNVDNSQNLYSKLNNSDNADKEAINRRKTKRYKEAIEGPTVYRN